MLTASVGVEFYRWHLQDYSRYCPSTWNEF